MTQQKTLQNSTEPYVVETLQSLIQAPSITPSDAGLMDVIGDELARLGFQIHFLPEQCGVKNMVAKYCFGPGPIMAFAGHVDVVPADPKGWCVDPFSADIINGCIYGRGAADMKGGIAAMLSATHTLCQQAEKATGTFYWLITSDEEGEAEFGSKRIAAYLREYNVKLDGCLVGEPTSDISVGDTIKNGRRGAISARIKVSGKAGHVAYPEHTTNAAHIAGEIVAALANMTWWKDEAGSKTHLQVTGISVPNSVDNLVPSDCEITFNIRYSHTYSSCQVQELVQSFLRNWAMYIDITWERPCEPYYTGTRATQCFLSLVERAVATVTSQYPTLSTSGGTSDGRFFACDDTQVVECGVRNYSIHQVNEHVSVSDLNKIEKIYNNVLYSFFCV
jgi:succinyl-diaminopimelate desuccinylase